MLLLSGLANAQQSAAPQGAEGPTPPGTAPARHWSGLPLMAEEALARGYELPLPFGVGVILTGIDDREIDVTDVRLGIEGSAESVSDYATLGSSSTVFNSNLRFGTWLLELARILTPDQLAGWDTLIGELLGEVHLRDAPRYPESAH